VFGRYQFNIPYDFTTDAVAGSGPNAGIKWVSEILDQPESQQPPNAVVFRYVITPALENEQGAFFQAQDGSYNPALDVTPACSATNTQQQLTIGYIAGATLLANTIRHEAGATQSHYNHYVTAQNQSSTNIGTVAEALLAAPSTTIPTFTASVTSMLADKYTDIINATAVEPCGGHDVRVNAQCTCSGYIRFAQ
jgi:hypothetical protein